MYEFFLYAIFIKKGKFYFFINFIQMLVLMLKDFSKISAAIKISCSVIEI